jgi:Acetyltransferase (GNAT) domain
MPAWDIVPVARVTDSDWESWDALNRSACAGHPLLTAVMARCLLAHFGHEGLMFASLRLGHRTLGHAVLARTSFGEWSVFCPDQAPLALIVLDPAARADAATLPCLLRSLPGLALALSVPLQDEPFSALPAEHRSTTETQPWGTTIAVQSDNGFDEYWTHRSRDLRKNIRRYMNRAEEAAMGPRLVTIDHSDELAEAVNRYALLESQGWKGSAGTALHPDNVQGAFYRSLLREFAVRGQAATYELYMRDRLAAARLLIGGANMQVILKTTYDETLKQYAPGRLLLYLLLQKLLTARTASRVEFYTRANQDSLAWATHRRPIVNASIFRSRSVRIAVLLRRRWLLARTAAQDAARIAED